MSDLRSKALACLREGRVTIRTAITLPLTDRPRHVLAEVQSSRGAYVVHIVEYGPGDRPWRCASGG